uniref:Gnk2-homologous domain-containing protein n=2 Tax=Chenopodium quinoa TaxID=63459 RepID=A0A803NE74_CHEQI
MACSINSLLFLVTIIVTCSCINMTFGVEEVDFDGVGRVCYGNSTTNDSTSQEYQNNVKLLLSVLVSESSSLHPPMTFISTSVGRVAERAYGSYLCRGDLSLKFSAYQEGLVFSYNSIGKNVSNYEQYNETLSNTMQGLVTEASYGNWTKANFATRSVEVTGSHEKIFALVQCAADLSPLNCSKCLGELYSYIPDCCNGSQGGILVHANCLMKYNNQSFF